MKKTINTYLAFLATLVCLWSAAGHALPIRASVESSGANGTISDTETRNSPGTVTAAIDDPNGVGPGFSGPATARAIQNSSGNAAVSVAGLYANGGIPVRRLTAVALLEETVTNNSAVMQSVRFNFNIAPIMLELTRSSRYGTVASTAAYDIDIRQDGAGIFASGAQLVGLRNLVQLFDDADTDPSATSLNGVVSGPNTGLGTTLADFGAFSGSIGLGILGPGLSTTIVYAMIASYSGRETESGGAVSIGDPLDFATSPGLTVDFTFSDVPGVPVPVPEPATLALFGLGLAAIGLARRRRKV